MSGIKYIPEYEHILEDRSSINARLFQKIENGQDMILVNDIIEHHMAVDRHVKLLESLIIDAQARLLFIKSIYDEILEQYNESSDREFEMMKWILKKKSNGYGSPKK